MRTKDLPGGFFAGRINYLDDAGPRIHLAPVREIDYPFRACYRSPHIRIRGTRGFVLGRWRANSEGETGHLLSAVRGYFFREEEE